MTSTQPDLLSRHITTTGTGPRFSPRKLQALVNRTYLVCRPCCDVHENTGKTNDQSCRVTLVQGHVGYGRLHPQHGKCDVRGVAPESSSAKSVGYSNFPRTIVHYNSGNWYDVPCLPARGRGLFLRLTFHEKSGVLGEASVDSLASFTNPPELRVVRHEREGISVKNNQ